MKIRTGASCRKSDRGNEVLAETEKCTVVIQRRKSDNPCRSRELVYCQFGMVGREDSAQ